LRCTGSTQGHWGLLTGPFSAVAHSLAHSVIYPPCTGVAAAAAAAAVVATRWLRAAARVRCRTVAMPVSLTACLMLLLLLPLGWLRVVARVCCGIVTLLLITHCCPHVAAAAAAASLVEGRSSCALWHAWGMTESRLGDPSAVRYLFKRALQANPRSRYTHLAWALWERRQVRCTRGGVYIRTM
jgi:hypothetical protein